MPLTSMKLTKAEAKAEVSPDYKPPEYPYGLRLCLNSETLDKLGLKQLPEIGTPMTLTARVEVCSVSAYESTGQEQQRSVDLQITDMALERAISSTAETASALYGGRTDD